VILGVQEEEVAVSIGEFGKQGARYSARMVESQSEDSLSFQQSDVCQAPTQVLSEQALEGKGLQRRWGRSVHRVQSSSSAARGQQQAGRVARLSETQDKSVAVGMLNSLQGGALQLTLKPDYEGFGLDETKAHDRGSTWPILLAYYTSLLCSRPPHQLGRSSSRLSAEVWLAGCWL